MTVADAVATSAGAVFSPDLAYRYLLWRRVRQVEPREAALLFVMLNPSTADGEQDDPTIRRCLGYARTLGYGWLEVVNLFAWRATDPRDLARAELDHDVIGPDNDAHILAAARRADHVICAWGVGRERWYRGRQVTALLRGIGADLHALAVNARSEPRHPLMLKASLTPSPWPGLR